MKSQERMKFWRRHIEAQRSSGESIAVYCDREKIANGSFYEWKKRLSASPRLRSLATRGFASVEIMDDHRLSQSTRLGSASLQLPDPKWTAVFVGHLLRGFAV